MKFTVKDFFGKCDQIRRRLQIWSQLLKKSLKENFIFCAVFITGITVQVKFAHSIEAYKKYFKHVEIMFIIINQFPYYYPL